MEGFRKEETTELRFEKWFGVSQWKNGWVRSGRGQEEEAMRLLTSAEHKTAEWI